MGMINIHSLLKFCCFQEKMEGNFWPSWSVDQRSTAVTFVKFKLELFASIAIAFHISSNLQIPLK